MSVTAERPSSTPPATPPQQPAPSWVRNLAIVAGLLGFVCFIATPFLPVTQTQSSLSWPQNGQLTSVNAPLISYSPESLTAEVPLAAADELIPGQDLLLGTVPADSEEASDRGLFVRSSGGNLVVSSRGEVIADFTPAEVAASGASSVSLSIGPDATEVRLGNQDETVEDDLRPMVTGVYSELRGDADAGALIADGLRVNVEINSRFTSEPTLLKQLATWVGLVLLVAALWALHRLDRTDGRASRRWLPARAFRPRPLDGIVGLVLAFWHFFGANTADDGYILTMARLAGDSTYMANYYRWFGVPEAPFGWPFYDIIAAMTHVSTASPWVRLPTLISGVIIWFVLSREVLPRLGAKVAARKLAHLSAAMVFLAFWLPYDNGTRPEPFIAMTALLAWVSFERAIATSRLFPAAVGTVIATISLAAGPTGLMAVAALLAAIPALIRILYRRLGQVAGRRGGAGEVRGWVAALAMLAPFLAAGTAILGAVFGDQTLGTVLEATRVRSEIGPSLPWYQESARYESLLSIDSVDGSFTRRFAVFMLLAALAVVVLTLVRRRRIPGAATDPTIRLVLTLFGTLFFLTFTPTKWTHHFGAFAGLAPAIAAVAAVALSVVAVRSRRLRTLTIGGFLMIFALALGGSNGWWYVSSFAVPWWDKSISLKGIEASSVMLAIAFVVLAIGVIQSFVGELNNTKADLEGTREKLESERRQANRNSRMVGVTSAPIAVLSAAVVAFSVACFAKSFVDQYPAYSVGLGNLRSVAGQTSGLAADALVETNTNDSFLAPADGSPLGESLAGEGTRGFDPNGVPSTIISEATPAANAGAIAGQVSGGAGATSTSDGGERAGAAGVNGSTQELPFNLDPQRVPVLGSYQEGAQNPAVLQSAWYDLPEQRSESTPLIVVSAAGRIAHTDINGIEVKGQEVVLEYGTREADGSIEATGSVVMNDIGPEGSWRNLRFPLDQLPEGTTVVRIKASDLSLDPEQWVAVTPPRVPQLDTLDNVIGSEQPGLLDWPVGLQFPNQRTFGHYAGVAEIPNYRISPDGDGKAALSAVQNYEGGGVLALAETVNYAYELPSYLRDDWARDWGSIEIYHRRTNAEGTEPVPAQIDYEEITRSGLWNPSEMNIDTSES